MSEQYRVISTRLTGRDYEKIFVKRMTMAVGWDGFITEALNQHYGLELEGLQQRLTNEVLVVGFASLDLWATFLIKLACLLFDVLLETARAFIHEKGINEFTGAELYHMALETHPELSLKRNTWGARMISSAPNHPSYRYSTARRSYFRYLGDGRYSLDTGLISSVNRS